jgi:hypothetical protein
MQAALTGLAIQVVQNPDWQTGQSTSVQVGINALPELANTGDHLFALRPTAWMSKTCTFAPLSAGAAYLPWFCSPPKSLLSFLCAGHLKRSCGYASWAANLTILLIGTARIGFCVAWRRSLPLVCPFRSSIYFLFPFRK